MNDFSSILSYEGVSIEGGCMCDVQNYEQIRSRIHDVVMAHFSSGSVPSRLTLENLRNEVMGVLEAPDCDESIKAEVVALIRATGIMLSRSIGDLDLARKYRIEFYNIYNYTDSRIKTLRYIIENLSSGMNNEDLIRWHQSFQLKLERGLVFVPKTILGIFVEWVRDFPLALMLKEAEARRS